MELTNAQTEEELYQKILDDMLNYNEQAAGHYDDYIGIFENFLAEYKSNLEELQRLKEMELSLKNSSDYLGGNGTRGYGKVKFADLQASAVAGEVDDAIIDKCNEILATV